MSKVLMLHTAMKRPASGLWIGQCFEVESQDESGMTTQEYAIVGYERDDNALLIEEVDYEKSPEERTQFKMECMADSFPKTFAASPLSAIGE